MTSSTTTITPVDVGLDRDFKSKVAQGLKEAAEKYGVELSTVGDLSDYHYMGIKSPRFGNRPLAGNSSRIYESNLRQLWRYCAMRGDYSSMLMLLKKPPAHCPSMSVCTKFLNPGQPLLDIHGEPILDVFETPITADGKWNAPKIIKIIKAAIHDLHVANGYEDGGYEEACQACLDMPDQIRHRGCKHHSGKPRLYSRQGDPSRNINFVNTVKNMGKLANEVGYEEKGCSQFMPKDLRSLRNRLVLCSSSLLDLQMYVIVICSTKLGYRHDEFHKCHSNHFENKNFEITDHRIDALSVKVFGKSDNSWISLKLHSDHEYTDLCPVRPLLVYMHLLGIKGGFLFPSEAE